MYKLEELTKYDYFKNIDIKYALDSLTGVVSRGYILGFAKNLVKRKIPFTMAILDIDNFKMINDNYGHVFGDASLKDVGKNLIEFIGPEGLVGRYGGDEFIIIYLGDTEYKNVHSYIAKMYKSGKIVRRRLHSGIVDLYITATTGCASYPKDAKNFDDLFLLVDKTLYRGKTKGRNCYIVYVEEKHKNIDVHKKDTSLLSIMMKNIYNMVYDEQEPPINDIVENVLNYINNTLSISKAIFIGNDNLIIRSSNSADLEISNEILDILKGFVLDEEVFALGEVTSVKKMSNQLEKFIEDNKISTFAISKIHSYKKLYGHILFIEDKVERIWQEKEVVLLMYVDRILYNLFEGRES